MGIIILLAGGLVFNYSPSPSPSTPDQALSQTQEATPNKAITSTPILKPLEPLMLLPNLSEGWDQVQVKSEEVYGFGQSRVYQGGRFDERLARLVYELHFRWREGDPPNPEWVNSIALRHQLLRRVNLNALKESKGKLYIPQNLYIELLGHRPEQRHQPSVGSILKLHDGLLVIKLKGKTCSSLQNGDLITDIRWIVRGRKRLNGQCKGSDCFDAFSQALKRKGRSKLRLTLQVERAQYENTVWQIEEVKLKCEL